MRDQILATIRDREGRTSFRSIVTATEMENGECLELLRGQGLIEFSSGAYELTDLGEAAVRAREKPLGQADVPEAVEAEQVAVNPPADAMADAPAEPPPDPEPDEDPVLAGIAAMSRYKFPDVDVDVDVDVRRLRALSESPLLHPAVARFLSDLAGRIEGVCA